MTSLDAPARPTPGPTRSYRFPAFERLTLRNGLSLIVAPVPKLPVVTVLALLDAGAAIEPAGQEGVAQLTALALAEGTERYDGAQLAGDSSASGQHSTRAATGTARLPGSR